MKRAEKVVYSLVRDLGMESSLRFYRIASAWDTVFHGPLALNTCPLRLSGGELMVNAASAAWLQEAAFCKSQMIQKLETFGVKDIRFRMGRVHRRTTVSTPPSRPVTGKEKQFIDEVVSGIGDEALAASVRRAMEKSFQTGRRRTWFARDESAPAE